MVPALGRFKMKETLWCLVVICQLFIGETSIWWNLGLQSFDAWKNSQLYILGAQPTCNQLPGLSHGQKRMCSLYYDHMPAVSHGAKLGIQECQYQFKGRRWNCSVVDKEDSVFGVGVINIGSKEAGFTHAISSAGVVFAVGRACRQGSISACGCSKKKRPGELSRDWLWGGCGDNIEYGYHFAEGFVDLREKEKNHPRHSRSLARTLMNLHNNEAGRKAVLQDETVKCKCHGVSGACSMKTCWQSLPNFRHVGNNLLDKYDGSTKVKFNHMGTRLVREERRLRKPTRSDLIFHEESPDYCYPDISVGSLGTSHRKCDKHSRGTGGCEILCCGRGYSSYTEDYTERCQCAFVWCCRVQCKTCKKRRTVHVCKDYSAAYRARKYRYKYKK
uniref:Protein Wnt n=1 Tax=Terebratalia transversa TaxID=34513 RepID=A0AAU7E8Y1_TERTR